MLLPPMRGLALVALPGRGSESFRFVAAAGGVGTDACERGDSDADNAAAGFASGFAAAGFATASFAAAGFAAGCANAEGRASGCERSEAGGAGRGRGGARCCRRRASAAASALERDRRIPFVAAGLAAAGEDGESAPPSGLDVPRRTAGTTNRGLDDCGGGAKLDALGPGTGTTTAFTGTDAEADAEEDDDPGAFGVCAAGVTTGVVIEVTGANGEPGTAAAADTTSVSAVAGASATRERAAATAADSAAT